MKWFVQQVLLLAYSSCLQTDPPPKKNPTKPCLPVVIPRKFLSRSFLICLCHLNKCGSYMFSGEYVVDCLKVSLIVFRYIAIRRLHHF
jgi:hypothetical protein